MKDVMTTPPQTKADFHTKVIVPDSYMGKSIDFTKPLSSESNVQSLLTIGIPDRSVITDLSNVDVSEDNEPPSITGQGDTLKTTHDGENCTVKLSIKFSDGKSAAAWSEKPIQVVP